MKYVTKIFLINTLFVTILLTLSNIVVAQTNQDFNTLLNAYAKAKSRYKLASVMQQDSEVLYWMEQYNFYHAKIGQIINDYDQAARKNPQAFCLEALGMYSKYININSQEIILDGMDDSQLYFNFHDNLSVYCSRYDIYYDPYKEKM